jgi:hypothetical protein
MSFDVILQWRQNMWHVIFHVLGFSWRKILYFQQNISEKSSKRLSLPIGVTKVNFMWCVFHNAAFWLDVTTSKDECTWTRLTSVVFTRKRPFTEELDFKAVKFVFFPRRDLNPHHWYTAAPFAKPYVQRPRPLDHIHSLKK